MSHQLIDAAYASIGTGVLLMTVAVWAITNSISKKCGKNETHARNADWLTFISIGFGTMTLLGELFGSGSVHTYMWMAVSVVLSVSIATSASIGINSYNKCDKEKRQEVCAKDKDYLIWMLGLTVTLVTTLVILKMFF